ncbi:hypothetical protein CL614_00890 [archaeon]|nr:hypothetical protein [archaeon]|tara:strand:+ start:4493 stop:5167 length:675 start_codon:yes stop_codon:yes gene_type:complete
MVKQPILELRNVTKTYTLGQSKYNALENVHMKIKKGEFVSIIGPSGSGKSTMLNMVGILDRPTKGNILIDNINTTTLDDNQLATIRGKKIGFVFQTFNLIPRFSALENVMLPMWFAGTDTETRISRAKKLLTKVGLEKRMNNKANQMSGGERQRVAIARALANNPEIILADEPTGNLDSKTGATILKILKDLNKEGNTLIIVTHDTTIAKQSDKKIKLLDGKIL